MIRSKRSVVVPLALVVVGSAFSLGACGGNQAEPASPSSPESSPPAAAVSVAPAAPAANASAVKEPGDAKVGDTTKCPVSGEEFTVEATSPKAEHDGKTYFLCCSGCKKKFEADPGKYIKKS